MRTDRTRAPGRLAIDLLRLTGMSAGYVMTWLLPERFDSWVVDRLDSLLLPLQAWRVRRLAAGMCQQLGSVGASADYLEAARDHYRMQIEGDWGSIRGLHRRGWQLTVRIEGIEKVRRLKADGRGAILWQMSFGPRVVTKAAFQQSGIPLIHLSEVQHGIRSPNWFSLRTLYPLIRRSEDRYLAERIVIPRTGSLGYMKTLINRLAEGHSLSIFAEHRGRQNVTGRLFHNPVEFATGAPSLAWKTGAHLFTVYVVREGRFSYRVVIEDPIEMPQNMERKEFARHAIYVLSRRLERAISEHPSDWMGWPSW